MLEYQLYSNYCNNSLPHINLWSLPLVGKYVITGCVYLADYMVLAQGLVQQTMQRIVKILQSLLATHLAATLPNTIWIELVFGDNPTKQSNYIATLLSNRVDYPFSRGSFAV